MTDADWPATPKWLTVAQLKAVLSDMRDDLRLIPNEVGNLLVHDPSGLEHDYAGFIDFIGEGEYERPYAAHP